MIQRNKSNIVYDIFFCYLVIIIGAQFVVSTNDAIDVHLSQTFEAPSLQHWLGTDDYGRDVLRRVIIGARYTLVVSLITLVLVVIIGVPLGLIAGYVNGWTDKVIMRLLDIGLSIPEFVLMIAMASFFKPSIWNLVIAITLIKWMNYTRLTRAIVNGEMGKSYIKMAKLFGVPNYMIIWKHVLPKVMPSILVLMTVDFGKIILYISSLSFLGIGAQPPSPEWGAMLNASRSFMESNPLLMIVPALMITITILIFNLVGDRLRDNLLNGKRESNE